MGEGIKRKIKRSEALEVDVAGSSAIQDVSIGGQNQRLQAVAQTKAENQRENCQVFCR